MPLLQFIASAGDFNDNANRAKIVILRRVGHKGTRAKVVDLTNLTSLSYAGMMVRPNDIVYVAPVAAKAIEENLGRIMRIAGLMLQPYVYYKLFQ
jgi:hypothetical protein